MADTTINDLDPTLVSQLESYLVSFIQEQYPSLDLNEGRVLRELLIRPAAMLHALARLEIQKQAQSTSMLAISSNPGAADTALVDALLSNYRITRNTGTKATGQVTIVIKNLLTTAVPVGTTFVFNNLSFVTTTSFVGVTTAEAANIDPTTQRQIFARSGSSDYAFVVDVEAVEAGDLYKIRRNSTASSMSPSPSGFITAYATADFSLGSNPQTNADLVDLFKLQLAPKVLSGRKHIDSLLREIVPTTKAVSVIGAGDAEMLRDKHNIFGVSTLGKVDIYQMTDVLPTTIKIVKKATLIDAPSSKWQVELNRRDYPGFYRVVAILPSGAGQDQGTLEITSEERFLDLTPSGSNYVPAIANLIEGGYCAYQTAILEFIDPDADQSTTPSYDLYVEGLPGIGLLQDFVTTRSVHNPCGDYVVKAPVPAYLALTLKVEYTDDNNVPNAGNIKQSLVNAVSGLSFDFGQLPLSLLFNAVHSATGTKNVLVRTPDIRCQILTPAGTILQLRGWEGVTIPNRPDLGVTSRTTVFYLGLDDIDLTIEKVSVLKV